RLLCQGNRPFCEALEDEIVEFTPGSKLDRRFNSIASESGNATDPDRLHSGNTPINTHTIVITTEAAKRYGAVNRWCSPSSIRVRTTTRKVAGVNGLTGKPVVI